MTSKNCLNSLAGVILASDKLLALERLREKNVLVPRFFGGDTFHLAAPVRRIFRQRKRKNSDDRPRLVEANEHPQPEITGVYDYALHHLESDREFKVHVFRSDLILLEEMKLSEGFRSSSDMRSYSYGWTGVELKDEPYSGLIKLAAKAVAVLGLDFGAVDILHGLDNEAYVLEVNTAPGLTPAKALRYAEKFVEWDRANSE